MQQMIAEGLVIQPSPGAVPRQKRYLDQSDGVPLQDIWTDIAPINSQAAERLGYPTQKPEALLERIVQSSSNAGDIVFSIRSAVVAPRSPPLKNLAASGLGSTSLTLPSR
jgi:hypothetical protein